jgi:hypothetical protein
MLFKGGKAVKSGNENLSGSSIQVTKLNIEYMNNEEKRRDE